MAETYITEEDRYVSPRVSQGNAYEDINTRAAANLGTMSGQMTLLRMQELQNSVSAQDLSRRKGIFEEDQRVKKQAEADDFNGFMMDNAGAPDFSKKMEEQLQKNPRLFNNEDVMRTLEQANKSTERINQVRADQMAGRNLDFTEQHEKEEQEMYRLKLGTNLDKLKSERDTFKAVMYDEENAMIAKFGSLLGNSGMDTETNKNLSNAWTDLKMNVDEGSRKEVMPTLLRLAGSFSGLSRLEEIESAKIGQHGKLMQSLAQNGFRIDPNAPDEELDKVLQSAINKFPERAGSIAKFRNDFIEARTAQTEIGENRKIFNEKLVQLNDLSKKAQLGDMDAQIERKRLLDEMAISAGAIEGKTNSIIEQQERRRKTMDEETERNLKATRILKYEADIANSRDDQERKDIEMKYKEAQSDSGALESARDAILDELEITTDANRKKELEKNLSRITNTFNSRSSDASTSRSGSAGTTIPR